MLIKPYTILDDENRDPFSLRHIGVVADNNDPERRKRVKVQIDPWSYLETADLPWVKQEGDGATGCSPNESNHHIPEIGSEVTVYFKNGDPNDPVYTGVETTEDNRCTLFDEGYPNSYGNKDSAGNYEIVNKESKTTIRQYASGTTVRADADGGYTIETGAGNYVKIDGNGEVWLYGPKIHICADDDIEMRATRISITASNTLDMAGQGISMRSSQGTQISSVGNINLGSSGGINLWGNDVNAKNFSVAGAPSGDITEHVTGDVYSFSDGILRGIMRG